MSQPPISAFELGRGISKQIGGAFTEHQDRFSLDTILKEAAKSGNVDDAIGQIISRVSPENQEKAMSVLEAKKPYIEREKNKAFSKRAGLDEDFAEWPSSVQNAWLALNKPKVDKAAEAKEAKEGAIDIVNRMKKIREGGRLGIMSGIKPSAAARKDRGEYEQLGKALIGFATKMPGGIRNQREFEALATKLYSPNMTDAAAAGLLDAMERMLSGEVKSADEATAPEEVPSTKSGKGQKKELTKDIAAKYFEAAGNDKKKAIKLAKADGYKV